MKIIGHRGAAALAPENTLASIKAAIRAGVDVIEIDVRVTKDGAVVLCHDKSIGKLKISESSFTDLVAAKPDLPTLEQALLAATDTVPLMVEIKRGVNPQPVIEILKHQLETGWKPELLWIGSKSYHILKTVKQALPGVPLVVIEPWSGIRAGGRARILGTDRIAMNQLWLWPGFIRAVSSRGLKLYAYTVNDPARAARWSAHGLAGVFTDNPNLYHSTETT